jgi:spermidine/putrescine transport system permease protein
MRRRLYPDRGGFAAVIATIVATMAALGTTRKNPSGPDASNMPDQPAADGARNRHRRGAADRLSRIKVWTGYTGLGYLMLAHTAFCIPFAYLPIRARLENMDLTLEPPPPTSTHAAGRPFAV